MAADEAFKEFSDWRNIALGVVVLLFMILLPQGLAGGIEKVHKLVYKLYRNWRPA